jgi:hypothetical protein
VQVRIRIAREGRVCSRRILIERSSGLQDPAELTARFDQVILAR